MIRCAICGESRKGIISGNPLADWSPEGMQGADHVHVASREIKQPEVETGFWERREITMSAHRINAVFALPDAERLHGLAQKSLSRTTVATSAQALSPEELAKAGQQALARLQAISMEPFDQGEEESLARELRRDLAGADLPLPTREAFGATQLIRGVAGGLAILSVFAILISVLALLL